MKSDYSKYSRLLKSITRLQELRGKQNVSFSNNMLPPAVRRSVESIVNQCVAIKRKESE